MKKKKAAALLLTGAMAVTMCAPAAVQAVGVEGVDNTLIAEFDFNTPASGNVISGTGAVANVNGTIELQDRLDGDTALYLNGNSGNYLSVTDEDGSSLLTEYEEITISFDTRQARTAKNWLFYAAPNANEQTWPNEHYLGMMVENSGITVERYDNVGSRPGNNLTGSVGTNWDHIDLVVSETDTKLYVNGTMVSQSDSSYKLSDILENSEDAVLYIGKANWTASGEYANCWIDNFRVWEGTLDQAEITAQYNAFADEMFWDGVSLPTTPIKEDLDLPDTNTAGDTVTWTSGNQSLVTNDGELRDRPANATEVQMTASIGQQTKIFTIIVAGTDTLLQEAYDALTLLNTDDVRGNLPLIKEGENGVAITWESSEDTVISDSSDDPDSLYDGGEVTRPAAGGSAVPVTLTATLSLDGQTKEKVFNVTVQPMPEDLDTDYTAGYLWTNFDASGGYEKIFFGYSQDGLIWEKLNRNDSGEAQPVLTNDAEGSDLGVRDPHILRSAEGDRYWILGTDLHAEGGGAGGSGWDQYNASQNIVVWESTDLVNWSEPRLVYAGFDEAGCVWAPEAIYDETTGDYLIYWSARDKSLQNTVDDALRVYVCRTRDFNTFSEPQVWLSEDNQSANVNIIDSTIVQGDDDRYYRFSTSDWNTVLDVSSTLDADDVLDVSVNATTSQPNESWTRLIERDEQSEAGFSGGEGLTVYQLPDGTWCAMADNSGYTAYLTDDLASGKFTRSDEARFLDGRFRHGTVMRLSEAEEARLMQTYGLGSGGASDTETEANDPILEYTFENEASGTVITDTGAGNDVQDNGTLFGNAQVVYDAERESNVLELNGTDNTYAQFPTGFFDGRDTMTISMDVRSDMDSGALFTFTYGRNSTAYNFLRIRGTEVRNAITTNSWGDEQEVRGTGAAAGTWQKVDLVIDGTNMKLYVDGMLVSENADTGVTTSNLGTGLFAYLGKSFYDDPYFDGAFDNVRVYNRALSGDEIAENALADEDIALLQSVQVGTVPEDPSNTMGTDDHTAVMSQLDNANKVITSYIRKSADIRAVPVEFGVLGASAQITVDGQPFTNGSTLDLSEDVTVVLTLGQRTETWTLKTEIANNPVLPGQYADPDIDYMDGKYWMYTTTDGYSGWSGTVFHAWSSEDLVNWTDEGVIMDLANDNPGLNEKGIQIASSDWAVGSAWAPSIEEKDGKYYFYYCGKGTNGTSAIGVAVADDPAGPYTDKGEALMTVDMCRAAGVSMGQAIDPSIFTDDDGTSYLLFGNGSAAIAELNDDMMSIKEGTIRQISGVTDFRESVVVTKRDGVYHFTWSCDDTGSPNYHVNYGTADSLEGSSVNVDYKYTLLQKDEENDMLGTAHQSILYFPETDECYIAYHRFYTPLGIYTDGLGYHRETCIDQVTFDENGLMQPLEPTMEGVSRPLLASIKVTPPSKLTYKPGEDLDTAGMKVTAVYADGSEADVTAEAVLSGYDKDKEEVQTITVTYEEDGRERTATFNVTVSAEEPEPVLSSIKVTPPTKLSYKTGEDLDTAGMKVTAVYSNNLEKDVTDQAVLSGFNKNKAGSQTVTVTYTEDGVTVTSSFAVTVTASEPSDPQDPTTDDPSDTNGGKDTAGQTDGNDKAVQTGDTTNLFLPAVMAVIALAAAASVIIIKKKRK